MKHEFEDPTLTSFGKILDDGQDHQAITDEKSEIEQVDTSNVEKPKKKVSIKQHASISNAFIEDDELEDFVPHFQRVSISGEDNTGVIFIRFS